MRKRYWPVLSALLLSVAVIGVINAFEVGRIPITVETASEVVTFSPTSLTFPNVEPHDDFERTIEVNHTSDNAQDVLLTLDCEDGGGLSIDIDPVGVQHIEPAAYPVLYHVEVVARGDLVVPQTFECEVVVERVHVP